MVDDVHLLEGSDAELALADLVRRLPARMRLLIASRVNLALDLSRLRVSGQLVEIGPDDLRFRAWEVEELFRDVYRDPLIPEDVATLARRTAGWAAYLQLFHLATARKPLAERRRVLASLANRSRLVQEYLTRHVLAGLSADLQDFLIRTSVLRRPTVALCDELLGWEQGSRELLAELERRQLFTDRLDDDSYRYHTVLLSYLEARLVETVGAKAARDEHRRAAVLLEREGLTEDAAAAFAKAEDWEGVARTLGHPAGSAAGLGGAWLEALPPTVVETDALLLMARARRALASGALADAVATMRAAEAVAASSVVAERCRQERDRIAAWMSPDRPGGTDWLAVLRGATQRQPREAQRAAASLPGAIRPLRRRGGRLPGRRHAHRRPAPAGRVSPSRRRRRRMAVGAQLMAMVAGSLCGRVARRRELDRLRDEVEEAAIPWLDRMARVGGGPGRSRIRATSWTTVADACQREGDRWGEALVALMCGTSCLWRRRVGDPLLRAGGPDLCRARGRGLRDHGPRLPGPVRPRGRRRGAGHRIGPPGPHPGLAAGGARLGRGGRPGPGSGARRRPAELARARELLEPLGTWDWHQRLGVGAAARPDPVGAETGRATPGQRDGRVRPGADRRMRPHGWTGIRLGRSGPSRSCGCAASAASRS